MSSEDVKDYIFLDKNSLPVFKGDMVMISGHKNKDINGSGYFCLRLWSLDGDMVECLKDKDGVVLHVVVDISMVEKVL